MLRDGEGRGLSPHVAVGNMTVAPRFVVHVHRSGKEHKKSDILFPQGNCVCGRTQLRLTSMKLVLEDYGRIQLT